MSDDCISRQAAIDVFKNAIGDKYPFICEPILITLSLIPPVNPQPKTGHWEWLTEDKYRCSNCNHETRVDECMNEPMYDFCPFCGARMESEGEE